MNSAGRIRYLGLIAVIALILSITAATSQKQSSKLDSKASQSFALFASNIGTIGATRYPASYGGQGLSPAGRLVIYVVPGHDSAFLTALHAFGVNDSQRNYMVLKVRHSLAQLKSLTMQIAAEAPRLRKLGIRLDEFGPNPALNKILITYQSKDNNANSELIRMFGSEWVAAKQTKQRVTIATGDEPNRPIRPDVQNRYSDTPPFYGADAVWFSHSSPPPWGWSCTSGFAWTLNTTGQQFSFTAAHCAGSHAAIFTNGELQYQIGNLSTRYYPPSDDVDIASVLPAPGESFASLVYGSPNTAYFVLGTQFPQANGVTLDGATSLEERDAPITAFDQCIPNAANNLICDLSVVSEPGETIVASGDSGGPVLLHTSDPINVYAVGSIVGALIINGTPDFSLCGYEQINDMLSLVKGSILDSGPISRVGGIEKHVQ